MSKTSDLLLTENWKKRQRIGTLAGHLVDDAHCLESSAKKKDFLAVKECLIDIKKYVSELEKMIL